MQTIHQIRVEFKKGDKCPCCDNLMTEKKVVIYDFENSKEAKDFEKYLNALSSIRNIYLN